VDDLQPIGLSRRLQDLGCHRPEVVGAGDQPDVMEELLRYRKLIEI